jgi:hypothetical protein
MAVVVGGVVYLAYRWLMVAAFNELMTVLIPYSSRYFNQCADIIYPTMVITSRSSVSFVLFLQELEHRAPSPISARFGPGALSRRNVLMALSTYLQRRTTPKHHCTRKRHLTARSLTLRSCCSNNHRHRRCLYAPVELHPAPRLRPSTPPSTWIQTPPPFIPLLLSAATCQLSNQR